MNIAQIVVTGLLAGGIYVLLTIPLNLMFGTMRIIHFAYGDFLMLAMFGGLLIARNTPFGIYSGGFALNLLLFVAVGVAAWFVLFRWLVDRSYTTQIMATLGIGIAFQNLALMFLTANVQSVRTPLSVSSLQFADVFVGLPQLIAGVAGVTMGIGILLFLKRSSWGRAMQAIAQAKIGAQVVGIPLRRTYFVNVVLTTALVGLMGALLLPIFFVFPTVGLDFIVVAFVVVVLGGMGSIGGGIVAAIVVGLIQSFTASYLGIQWANVTYFALFIVVLVVRPAGLGGIAGTEELGH